jgi:hypothetical protein
MENKNNINEQVEGNYYDAFVDSILSLPAGTRSFILNVGAFHATDNNPYLWLWETYCNETESDCYLHNLLDSHNLAID